MTVNILHILFALFLLYTWFYVVQWIGGLYCAITRLEGYRRRRLMARYGLEPETLPKVSVLIAAYNESACVVETIRSILEEDYPELEVILTDDGSTDGMARKVIDAFGLTPVPVAAGEGYERRFDHRRILLLRKEKGGKASALNFGLQACNSPYCLVLDADTKVQKGSLRVMVTQFRKDPHTIVCAGAVGCEAPQKNSLLRRCLIRFQILEYFRTFYLQRILLDRLNANIIVSGAFAMFDTQLLKDIGGYQEGTIGEDMELTMRLHAFCHSQKRQYRIAYVPEAKCLTQFPGRYRDFFRQRRRWQIGMIQSMRTHRYMLMNKHYGWAGTLASSVFLLYELLAPFIEILGAFTLLAAFLTEILNVGTVLLIMAAYYILMLCMQMVLVQALKVYGVEKLPLWEQLALLLMAAAEFFSFHLINSYIKIMAIVTYRLHSNTWQHIKRSQEVVK